VFKTLTIARNRAAAKAQDDHVEALWTRMNRFAQRALVQRDVYKRRTGSNTQPLGDTGSTTAPVHYYDFLPETGD
jgi:hypothetical protein